MVIVASNLHKFHARYYALHSMHAPIINATHYGVAYCTRTFKIHDYSQPSSQSILYLSSRQVNDFPSLQSYFHARVKNNLTSFLRICSWYPTTTLTFSRLCTRKWRNETAQPLCILFHIITIRNPLLTFFSIKQTASDQLKIVLENGGNFRLNVSIRLALLHFHKFYS